MDAFRIGNGFDVHRLVPDRKLILCGVHIPYALGLAGHSDADVAIHALCDALLGAIAAGDIGLLYPDNDPAYRNIDSSLLLQDVCRRVHEKGYVIANVDVTIIAEKPKVAPFREAMREHLATVLECPADNVSVKATTTEGLGFTGRGEGIACMATACVRSRDVDNGGNI